MEWFKYFDLGNFRYASSKFIMLLAFLIVLVLGFVSLNYSAFSGKTYYYSSCDSVKCFNAFYKSNLCLDGTIPSDDPLCSTEFMFKGQSLGEQAPFLVRNFVWFGVGIVLLALLLNTLIFNKGFFRWLFLKLRSDESLN